MVIWLEIFLEFWVLWSKIENDAISKKCSKWLEIFARRSDEYRCKTNIKTKSEPISVTLERFTEVRNLGICKCSQLSVHKTTNFQSIVARLKQTRLYIFLCMWLKKSKNGYFKFGDAFTNLNIFFIFIIIIYFYIIGMSYEFQTVSNIFVLNIELKR